MNILFILDTNLVKSDTEFCKQDVSTEALHRHHYGVKGVASKGFIIKESIKCNIIFLGRYYVPWYYIFLT